MIKKPRYDLPDKTIPETDLPWHPINKQRTEYAYAYTIGCTYCNAKPGHKCINKLTGDTTRLPHNRRIVGTCFKDIPDETDWDIF